MMTAFCHGHDVSWAPDGSYIDLFELHGQPVSLVESDAPDLAALAFSDPLRVIMCGRRWEIVQSYLDGVDPGRCSVRRDLLAACDAARGGTHAQRDAALDALLASVRD